MTKTPQITFGPTPARPALRRGALIAVPIGVTLAIEFGFDVPTQGAIATGALLAGFPGLDAPARPRAAWQAATAPLIGAAAGVGVLSNQSALLAVLVMGLVVVIALTIAAALSFGLLTVQYALFTAAITTYVVLLSDTLGEGPFEAAGQRLLGTALGILVAALAFVVWPSRGQGGGEARKRASGPSEAAAR